LAAVYQERKVNKKATKSPLELSRDDLQGLLDAIDKMI
jgi:hypothetical protein